MKIDSIYEHRSGRSSYSYEIEFCDEMKKQTISLSEDTYQQKLVFTRIVNDSLRRIDLVKIENCNAFIQCSYKYYQFDNRFICDKNGICQFTKAYKRRQVIILILGAVFFIIATTITWKLFNSKFVKTL